MKKSSTACFCLSLMLLASFGSAVNAAESALMRDWRALQKQQEYQAALQMLEPEVQAANPEAIYLLGRMISIGQGLPKDKTKAFEHFLDAANKGYVGAMARVGTLYKFKFKKSRDARNAKKSFYWTQKAAEAGSPAGLFNLAINYESAIGVPRNLVYAHMWMDLAARQEGNPVIKKFLKMIAKQMTSAEINTAKELATACEQLKYKGC